ncbi:MAG: Delta(1)-pyrroline-2-carboxylate reductase [Alphaproteobacteria bacterium MarineAlpha11_Bin1]|nr:MAG: Delta(1)-pyrroline-2-carboxylate reductase [Alphaproteobacteria bacterium MarineAlpha11_Bin1]
MTVLLLKPDDLRNLVSMKDAINAVEQGYKESTEFPVINGPRRRVHSPEGVRVSNFPGGVHQLGVMGAQVRAELVVQEGNTQRYGHRELPVHVLHDSSNGRLLAILFGEIVEKTMDPSSLMAFRTAATSGIGFRHLVRRDASIVGLFGSGGQAANQLLALITERPTINLVKVFSRNPENRRVFAETYSIKFGVEIEPVDSPEPLLEDVDVIICATNTNVELFDGNRLMPGQHVTGIIGSNKQLVQGGFLKRPRREIDDATALKADVIVTNLKESMLSEEQGDLFGPIERGLIRIDDVFELGDFATARHPGRTTDQQITYHKNNNGTGSSEMAMAMTAYRRALEEGRGTEIDLD